ncbi:MAG: deoxyribonuclease IV, partial [bacterium]
LSDIVVHAPYIINLGSYKENIYELATSFLRTELTRTQAIGSKYLVLHPGAYTDKDMEYGLNRIVEGLNIVLEDDDLEPIICLETMAGKGTEIGGKFEELAYIINNVKNNDKLGVCFDTCHVHDSGYDIVNDFEGVIKEFDEIVGLDRLHVMHINGSLNKMGAKKDRHANLGAEEDNPKGKDMIGFDAIYNIVHSKHLENKVFILETPWLDTKTNLYKEEIARLRADR